MPERTFAQQMARRAKAGTGLSTPATSTENPSRTRLGFLSFSLMRFRRQAALRDVIRSDSALLRANRNVRKRDG
jgi:hypothetical protein